MRVKLRSGDQLWSTKVDAGDVSIDGTPGVWNVTEDDAGVRVECAGQVLTGAAVRDRDRVWVTVAGELFDFTIDGDGAPRRSSGRDQSALMPPMPATVLRVNVKPGDAVADGDVLVVLEAMKMELSIRAPRDGVISAVHCAEGDMVQPETLLIAMAQ
jgi:3-methylcrotonyl-CoA carboxylase alpha subunit